MGLGKTKQSENECLFVAPSSSKFCRSVDCPSTRVDSQRACGHRVAFRRHHRRCRRPIMASPTMPPTLAKSFSVSPSKLKVGDEEELQLLPSGCKIKVDWNLKSPKMELKNQTDGETLRWHLSEVSKVVFVTTPGEEVCMRLHLDTDTPEGKGGGETTEEGGPLATAVSRGALRRGWKVVYLQRQDADKS